MSLPVEAHLDHVVPPDVVVDGVMRVVVPAVLDVPHPGLAPKNVEAVEEDAGVEKPAPSVGIIESH